MKKYDVHICLAEGNTIANLTPVLDRLFKPKKVILVGKPEDNKEFTQLVNVLEKYNVEFEVFELNDTWCMTYLLDKFTDLAGGLEGQSVALNISGGTKPMTLAAQEAFRMAKIDIFFVHLDKDHISWLYPRGETYELEDKLCLKHYFMSQGYTLVSGGRRQIKPEVQDLLEFIVTHTDADSSEIGQLNYLASKAKDANRLTVSLRDVRRPSSMLPKILEEFRQADLANTHDGDTWTFRDEEALFLANGGWLEEYVYSVMHSLSGGMQDYGMSLEVTKDGYGSKNELDGAFLFDNRLHVIECKTARFEGSGKGVAILHKLDSLRDLTGGLHAKAYMISYKKLPDYDTRRARDLNIEVISAGRLRDLRGIFENILDRSVI